MRKKCTDGLLSLDMFGEQINLTYKGRDTFTTLPGSLISLAIIIIVLAMAGYKMTILVSRRLPNITQTIQMRDLNFEGKFQPQSLGFDFAFGIGSYLDPSYGYYHVNEVHYYFSDEKLPNGERNRIKETKAVSFTECGTNYFNFQNKDDIKLYGIDRMMCVKDKESYSLEGDYYSTHFRYLEVKLIKCDPSISRVTCKTPS